MLIRCILQQWAGIIPTNEPTVECTDESSLVETREADTRTEMTSVEVPVSQQVGNGGKTAALPAGSDLKIMEQIKTAVVSDELYKGANYKGGHAICCVGYNDEEKAWICKNSWGTGWGMDGFFKIGYGECNIEADPCIPLDFTSAAYYMT